jgi:hypothetical protein
MEAANFIYEKVTDFNCCVHIKRRGVFAGKDGKKEGQENGPEDGHEERLYDDEGRKDDDDEKW